jgi:hypothetical protein
LARIDAEIEQPRDLTARVLLKGFVLPDDVRSTEKEWSDYIDYWAVDWDYQDHILTQGWTAYRTRRERKLPLVSGSHTYEKAGRHRILVRVIDIFGNDTRQELDVEFQQP